MAVKNGTTAEGVFAEAVNLHQLGVDGDKEAVKKTHEMFKKMYNDNPRNCLAEAYLGSATALLGRDDEDLDKRFKLALEGLKLLDQAVSNEPQNIEIRILRGMVCYSLPDMYFHRLTTAVEDFSFMVSRYKKNKNIFSRELYCKILFDLGSAYKKLERTGEAESTWRKLLSVTKDPKYKELLRQEGFYIPNSISAPGGKPETYLSGESLRQFEEAKDMHRCGLAGDKDAVQKAYAYFERAHRENPQDHLILAYYADCLSMMGRDAGDNSLVFGNAIKALIDFDKAAKGSPDNIKIRLLRANHSCRLPEVFFRRSATAIGDCEYLIQRYEQDNSIFDNETYFRILGNLGEAYERLEMNEEAKSIWAKLLSLTDDTKYQARLEKSVEETNFDPVKARTMNWKQALQEGIRLHDLGVAGNKKAAKIAEALLKGLYKENPQNPVAAGYYGSSMALVGRNSSDSSLMFSNGIKGFQLVKKAAARDPMNPQLRLLRGYLAYNLPETFFHLSKMAIEDFRFLIQAYNKDTSVFSKELYWQILHDLGATYQRVGNNERAQKVWKKLVKESRDSKYEALLNHSL